MSKTVSTQGFNHKKFSRKIATSVKKAGYELIEKALWLYYAAEKPSTPRWAKMAIYSALGYFIVPIDVIPDFILATGYTDDLAVIALGLSTVAAYVDDAVKQKTRERMSRLNILS